MTEATPIIDPALNEKIREFHYSVGQQMAERAFEHHKPDFAAALDAGRQGLVGNAIEIRELHQNAGYEPAPIAAGLWELAVMRGFLDTAEKLLQQAIQ